MTWRLYRSLENSLKDFIDAQITSDSLKAEDGSDISVRIGRKEDDNWTLPCISLYNDSETLERFEIGSNKRDDRQLIIIDLYAMNEGERLDLAKFLVDAINDGWRYYSYSYNPSNPESPTKVAGGWVNVNFVENTRVALGQNVDVFDAHRHRISINVWISGT